MVLDISKPAPQIREATLFERLTYRLSRKFVFFASYDGMDRVPTVCLNLLTNLQIPTLTKVLQIHDCIRQIKPGIIFYDVAAKILTDFGKAFSTAPESMQEQLLPAYLSSVRAGLSDNSYIKLLKSAETLRRVFPNQAREMIQAVQQDNTYDKEHFAWTEKQEWAKNHFTRSCCQCTTVKLLQDVAKEINVATDPEWELKLRTLLIATKKLSFFFQIEVCNALRDSISLILKSKDFPGIKEFETLQLLSPLRLAPVEWIIAHTFDLPSSYARRTVHELEEAVRNGNIDQQIDCVERLSNVHNFWKAELPALDISLIQTLLTSSLVKALAEKYVCSSWECGPTYDTLSVLAPEVAKKFAQKLPKRLKLKMPKDDVWEQLHWLEIQRSLFSPFKPIDRFVEQQICVIACDIAKGRIKLASLKRDHLLIEKIVGRFKGRMKILVKNLGRYGRRFFEIYGKLKLRKISEELPQFAIKAENSCFLDIKEYLEVPQAFRADNLYINQLKIKHFYANYTSKRVPARKSDMSQLELAFNRTGKVIFARPDVVATFLKFGQLCYWLKKLFSVQMASQKISDTAFESITREIERAAPCSHEEYKDHPEEWPGKESPLRGRLKSLDDKGYEDPAALLDALPIETDQKARLIQVYQQSLIA
jgi:hypothetical protein